MEKKFYPMGKVQHWKQCLYQLRKEGIEYIEFAGSVKVHGTNSAIVTPLEGESYMQSRNRVLETSDDHFGFTVQGWSSCHIRETEYGLMQSLTPHNTPLVPGQVLYGEWCGPGVQKGVAVSEAPHKFFQPFCRYLIEEDIWLPIGLRYTAHVRPQDPLDVARFEAYVEEKTLEVEEECPVAKELFGISGVGEGIVWYPVTYQGATAGRRDLWFKSKGTKHSRSKVRKVKSPGLSVEQVESLDEFLKFALNEDRLQQGLDYLLEMGLPIDRSSTGAYLKWVMTDVAQECNLELQQLGLEWKKVQGPASKIAREYLWEREMGGADVPKN